MSQTTEPNSYVAIERDTSRRLLKRLLPILILGYFVAYLDRSTVAIAALSMNESIGLTAAQFGLGAGLFYLTYIVFEMPSNVILPKVGARVWLCRIMVTWGLVTMATSLIEGDTSFYIARLLLGAAEAGFIPGVLWYLTRWFPTKIRVGALTVFGIGNIAAVLFGSPILGLLLKMDGVLGIEGWRWLFILSGVPALAVAFVILKALTNEPAQATWLPEANKRWLLSKLSEERTAIEAKTSGRIRDALKNPAIVIVTLVYFLFSANATGLTLWMPQVIRGSFGTPSDTEIAFLAAIPSIVAIAAMLLTARSVKKRGRPVWHLSGILVFAGVGLAFSILAGPTLLGFILLALAAGGGFGVGPIIWQIASRYATGVAAAAAFAFINSMGNLAGLVMPFGIGAVKEATGTFEVALFVVAGALVVGGLIAIALQRIERPAIDEDSDGEPELAPELAKP